MISLLISVFIYTHTHTHTHTHTDILFVPHIFLSFSAFILWSTSINNSFKRSYVMVNSPNSYMLKVNLFCPYT